MPWGCGEAPDLPGLHSCAAHAARGVVQSVVPVHPLLERASLPHILLWFWPRMLSVRCEAGKHQSEAGEHGAVIVGFGYHLPDDWLCHLTSWNLDFLM